MIFPDKEAGSYCVCYAFGQCVKGEDVQEGIVSYDVLPFFVKLFLCNFQGKFKCAQGLQNARKMCNFATCAKTCKVWIFRKLGVKWKKSENTAGL